MDTTASSTTTVHQLASRRPRLVIVEASTSLAQMVEAGLWQRFRVSTITAEPGAPAGSTLSAARSARPELALVATRLGASLAGEAVIDGLTASGTTVVALCPTDRARGGVEWGRSLRAGALSVVSYESSIAEVADALDQALRGRSVHEPADVARLVAEADDAAPHAPWAARAKLDALSRREREIVGLLVHGHGVAEVARRSVVSEATVRTQVKSILAKLDVRSQLGAVAVVRQAAWPASSAQLPAAG